MQTEPNTESSNRPDGRMAGLLGETFAAKVSQLSDKLGAAYLSWKLPWFLIGLGIVLRLTHYLGNRSLRYDEAGVTLNIVDRSLMELMQKLDGYQVAPPAFLAVEKFAVQLLGTSEFVLRLFPLFMGIASLFLFYGVAKAFLRPRAIPIALGLFAISHIVVRFSSEVKQYSGDVAIALLITYMSYRLIRSGFSLRWVSAFAVVGALAIWFSHASVLMLAGSGTVIVVHALKNHPWTRSVPLLAMISIWLINFAFIFTGQSGHSPLDNPAHIQNFAPLFLPFPPTSPADIEWYLRTFFVAFHLPAGILLSGVAGFAFILGIFGMVGPSSQRKGFDKRVGLALLVFPILFTIAVSAVNLYPLPGPDGLGARLSIFMVPILLLLVGEGTEYLRERIHPTGFAPTYLAMVGLLFLFPVLSAAEKVTDLRPIEEMRPLVGYIIENRQPGDAILTLRPPQYSFRFYARELGLTEDEFHIYHREELIEVVQELRATQANPRAWVTLGHITVEYDELQQEILIQSLDEIGTVVDSFTAPDVRLYLYEF